MFANRPIHFSNFWNICKTKSGKLVTGEGEFQIRKWGVRQKIKKSISRGRGVGGGLNYLEMESNNHWLHLFLMHRKEFSFSFVLQDTPNTHKTSSKKYFTNLFFITFLIVLLITFFMFLTWVLLQFTLLSILLRVHTLKLTNIKMLLLLWNYQ